MSRSEFVVLCDEELLVIGVVRNVFLAGWRDAPTVDALRDMDTLGRLQARERGPLALINVAYTGTPRFSEEVRRLTAANTADPEKFPICRAHVVALGGMAGAAVRAFMNTFIRVGRPPHPTKLLGTVDDAIDWALPHLEAAKSEPAWTPDELRGHLDTLQARVKRTP